MSLQLYFATIVFSLLFIFLVIELVRRGALREQYSLLWLGLGVVMLILSISRGLLFTIARWFGVVYAPSLIFLFGLLCAIALLLHVTIALSSMTDRMIRLTQELAITQHRLSEVERLSGIAPPSNPLSPLPLEPAAQEGVQSE